MYRYLRSGSISCHSSNSEAIGAHDEDEPGVDPAIAGQVMGEAQLRDKWLVMGVSMQTLIS